MITESTALKTVLTASTSIFLLFISFENNPFPITVVLDDNELRVHLLVPLSFVISGKTDRTDREKFHAKCGQCTSFDGGERKDDCAGDRFLIFLVFFRMLPTEELLASFLFLFLKHLSLELSHLVIVSNHQRTPSKSILRTSRSLFEQLLSLNQNNSLHLSEEPSMTRRQVFFSHIDSFSFDPRVPCRFLGQLLRQPLSSSLVDREMQRRCDQEQSKRQCKVKLKRQRRFSLEN